MAITRNASDYLKGSETSDRWHRSRVIFTWWFAVLAVILLTIAVIPTAAQVQVSVTTNRNNNQRTNVNTNETILTPANVNFASFGRLFSQSVDGYVFAQPLYVPSLTIKGAVHNVVYIATEHDSVYAFDADSSVGSNAQPLWHTNFLLPGATTVSSADVGCDDIVPEYGITGTPVIDLSTNTLYVVSDALENNGANYVKRFHALDITTGAEKPGSPIIISASVAVSGQNPVAFDTQWEHQRSGLLLYSGVVYFAFGSHCDNSDEIGWILGYSYNGSSFSQVFVFSDEPSSINGKDGGIWMAGAGLLMDSGSNMFVATGNGAFDTNLTPPVDYADSIIRIDLSQGPTVQDYFTAWDQSTEEVNDLDLGSGGIALLPNQSGPYPHLLVQAGKEGVIHVVNRDNGMMGGFNASGDQIVQEITGIGGIFSSPAYFNGKIYFWGVNDVLKAFTVTNGLLSTSPTDQGPDGFGYPGANPTISANGTSNGIVWALNSGNWSKTGPGGPGVLYAYDAGNLAAGYIYNSFQNGTRDNPGGAIKFAIPTVANGKVYVGAEGQFSVYGELGPGGGTAPAITSANQTTFTVGAAGSFTVSTTGVPAPSLTETGTLPSGVTFQDNGNGSGMLSGTPAAGTGGSYAVTITANNGVGTAANQSFTLTITQSNQAPAITSANSTSFTVGVAGNFTVTTTGTPTPSLTETGTLPSSLTFKDNGNGTATLSGTPATGTVGSYPLTITASNGVGTPASQGFTLTVNQITAPVITSGTTAGGTVGVAFSYQITGTNSPTSYGATGLPAGLSVNTSSGLISGTPSGAGTATVTLSATNGGGTGHATLTLTISTVVTVSSVQVVAAAAPGSASTLSLSFAQNTVAGDLILVAFDYDTNATPSSVTDSQGNVFTPIGNQLTSPGGARSRVYYAKNIKGGADRVTVNLSANSGWLELYLSEYTGVDQTNPVDAQAGASGGAGAVTSGNGTTTVAGDVIYGYCVADWACTAGSGFITRSNLNANLIEDELAGNAGTYAATGSANNGWSMQMVALKPASSGVGAPVITSGTTASGTVGVAFSYQITATNSPTSYGATGLPAGLSVNTSSGLISGTPTGAGTATVTLSATNGSGTGNATLTLTITVAAPVITSGTTASGTVGTAFSYQITATNSPTSYGATGLPAGLSVNTSSGLISGTPTGAGTSTVTLSATNGSGTGHATLTLTITAAAPVITSTTTASGTVGVAFSYQITATNSPTSYGATGLPAGLSVNTSSGLISGTPTGAGTSTVTLSATNGSGTGHATLTLTITAAAPVITSTTTASGTVGTAFSYQITATNSPTSYGATGLPAGLSVNTSSGLISGTPTGAGTSTVTLSATNGSGTGHATLTLTITAAAPVITSTTTASGTVGVAFSYQITATNSPTSYGATGLPAGLSVNTSSGLISGTPSGAGTSTVTLSATNSGGTGHATLTLTISTVVTVSSVQVVAAAAPGSASTLSLSFAQNTVAGDLILVAFDYDTNATPSSVTDSQGNVFTPIGNQLTSPGGARSRVYYAKNIKGGADRVTVNLSANSGWLELYLSEYTGVDQTNPIDAQAGASGNAGAVSSGNATTTVAGDVIYGYCVADWACTAGSGFTTRSNLNANLIEDELAGNPGTYAATGSANNGWTMQMVALKP